MDGNCKYLLLDMDMTILNFKKSEKYAFMGVMESLGLTFTEADYTRYSQINDSFWKIFEKGQITRADLLSGRFGEFGKEWDKDPAILNKMFINNLASRNDWLPGAEDFLRSLKDSGKYKVCLATNGPVFTVTGRIKASGVEKYVDGIYISEAIGAQKPDPAFFRYIFDDIGDNDITHYLMIGDRVSSDIKGANNVGMKCVLFAHDGKFPGDLGDLKIDHLAGSFSELQNLLEVP